MEKWIYWGRRRYSEGIKKFREFVVNEIGKKIWVY
jgi:hypothetical protein